MTLSEANGVAGSYSSTSIAATSFSAGVATATPTFSFTTIPTIFSVIKPRITDADGVSSSAGIEGTANLYSGRLGISNAFGSGGSALQMPVRAYYWSGKSWVTNSTDSCTTIPATAIALSNYLDSKGAATNYWTTTASGPGRLANGLATITLAKPSPASTGSVSVAINLGVTSTDSSCLSTHPATTGSSNAYLRGRYGNCAASSTYTADPLAIATFGVYTPESKKTVHIREIF